MNDAGQSEWAGPAQATRVMPPSPPTGLSASISGNDIAVSWTTPSTGIIDRYEVEYLGPNSDEWTRDEVPSSTTSWTHAAPTPGTAYQYRARSVNSAGVSNWTASVSRTWYQGAAPPTSIGINMASSTYVVVQWATSTDRGVTYDMRTSVNGGTPTIQNTGTRAIKVDYYAAADTHREYAVRAVKDGTPGDWTHTIRASLTQPGQPTDFTVNLESKTSIRLHWSHPDTGEPYRYIVEKKKQGESNYTTDLAHNTSGFIRNKLLDGFDHDTTYHIRVRAQSHSGETSPAEGAREVTVTIPERETVWPLRPSSLRIMLVDRTTFRLTWNEQTERKNRVTGYRIYRKDTSDTGKLGRYEHVLVSNTGSASTTFTDHTGTPGVTYEYGIAVRWDNTDHPVQGISTTAFARPW